jgi:hypothetical protein
MRGILARGLQALLLAGSLVSATPAQWSTAPPDSALQDFQRRLLLALDLTPTQTDSLRVLRDGLQLSLDDLRAAAVQGDLLPEERRLQVRDVLERYRTARDSVLTGPQRDLLERARRHWHDRVLYAGLEAPDEEQSLAEALGLDALQRQRWLALLGRLRDRVQTQRADGLPPTTDDYRRLREEYRLSFEAMLTPDQRLELERVRQTRMRTTVEGPEVDAGLLPDFEAPVEDAWESLDSELDDDG